MAESTELIRHRDERSRQCLGVGAFPQKPAGPASLHDDVIGKAGAGACDTGEAARIARRQAPVQGEVGYHRRMSAGGSVEIVGPRQSARPSIEVGAKRDDPGAFRPPGAVPRNVRQRRGGAAPCAGVERTGKPCTNRQMRMRVDEAGQDVLAAKHAPFVRIRSVPAAHRRNDAVSNADEPALRLGPMAGPYRRTVDQKLARHAGEPRTRA